MSPDPILDDVCCADPRRVAAALQAAGPQREQLAAPLLARLADAATNPKQWGGENKPSPCFLLHLAAAWRLTAAHPLLIALLRLPEADLDRLLGDTVTEDAATVLADTFDGDATPLHALLADHGASGFARGAGLRALALLAHRDRYPRAALLDDVSRLASTLQPGRDSDVVFGGSIVNCLLDLQAWELRGVAFQIFDRGLIDPFFISREEVETELVPGYTSAFPVDQLDATITDAWAAVAHWHFFSPLGRRRRPVTTPVASLPKSNYNEPARSTNAVPPDGVIESAAEFRPLSARTSPKIGRNEPCPCGSGKKYKKCCGR